MHSKYISSAALLLSIFIHRGAYPIRMKFALQNFDRQSGLCPSILGVGRDFVPPRVLLFTKEGHSRLLPQAKKEG